MIDAIVLDAPQRPWRTEPRRPSACITDVLRRWNAGDDSAAIAAALGIPEADVCRIIGADQDRRHAARAAAQRQP
jgi:hypothetical protein